MAENSMTFVFSEHVPQLLHLFMRSSIFLFSPFIRVPYFLSIIFNAQTDPSRSRQAFSIEYLIVAIGIDAAGNGPFRV